MPINSRAENLSGGKFGLLTAIRRSDKTDRKGRTFWECECECGAETVVASDKLKRAHTRSCGCLARKHGMSKSREFSSWKSMKGRCMNPNDPSYHNYGGRGISVSERWIDSFEAFYEDMGERPEGTSLDRIDNSKSYSKANCKWSTVLDQCNNTRVNKMIEIDGEVMTVSQAGRKYGISRTLLDYRLSKGKKGLDLVTPPRKWVRKERNMVSAHG